MNFGSTMRAIAQMKPTSSRATATIALLNRYRAVFVGNVNGCDTVAETKANAASGRQQGIVGHGGCGSVRLGERLAQTTKSLRQFSRLGHIRQRIPAMHVNKTGSYVRNVKTKGKTKYPP